MPVIPRMGGSAGGCGVHRREVSRESGSLKTSKPRPARDSAPQHRATDRGHAANGILIGLRGYTPTRSPFSKSFALQRNMASAAVRLFIGDITK
jgi:hypothetical protein